MDIIDGYMLERNKLIIYISGDSGSGKSRITKRLGGILKMDVIRQRKFIDLGKIKKERIGDGINVYKIYSYDVFDFDRMNKEINDKSTQKRGIIISGMVFPKDKTTKPTLHIHLKTSKEDIIKRREEFMKKHNEEIGKTNLKKILDKITYPFYKKTLEDMTINKFISISGKKDEEIIDILFDIIINFIQSNLKK